MSALLPLHDGWTVAPGPAAAPAATAATAADVVPGSAADVVPGSAADAVSGSAAGVVPATAADAVSGSAADVVPGAVRATVPGCVHTDLLAAGLIGDPYLADNERSVAWIGHTDWVYETTFEWRGENGAGRLTTDPTDRVDLVCDGLDTVATITLNGGEVGRTANMHRSYRFDVRPLLRLGRNRLSIRFESAYRYAEAVRDEVGERPGSYDQPFQYLRKMACNFGWDWGPTLVTAGIWQPIGLHAWSTARLAEVRPLATVDGAGHGIVDVTVVLERAADVPLTVTAELAIGGAGRGLPDEAGARAEVSVAAGESTASVRLTVAQPQLWWPRGYGAQPRYPLTVTLTDNRSAPDAKRTTPGVTQTMLGVTQVMPGATSQAMPGATHQTTRGAMPGTTLDTWRRDIGFRSVRLDTSTDADGRAYRLVVNDVPVFVRGANWIPDDCFPTRVDRARYAARLGQVVAAGINYLRVWGGGRYESDDFYDLADALGILVGQDFAFACAAYPEEEPLAGEIEAEAREQVARLTPHPSLVVWTGGNETLWGYADWDWESRLGGRTWGLGYYLDVLPAIVAELDPTRPYWPNSPYSGEPETHPNEPSRGTVHIWDVWNTHDYLRYRAYRPRFVAEFGFQGPPAYPTLRRAIGDAELACGSAGLESHQKQVDGNARLLARLAGHLPEPETFDDWHYATQLNQARAIRFGIEHFRSLSPLCSGTIVWQLNDCWPVTSWSAIDGDGRRKPLWYALRRAYADRLLTIQPRGRPGVADGVPGVADGASGVADGASGVADGASGVADGASGGVDGAPTLVAVNDTATAWAGEIPVTRRSLDGTRLAGVTVAIDVPARGARTVALPDEIVVAGRPAAELLVAGEGEGRALWFFVEDVELDHVAPGYSAAVRRTADGYRVTITAATLLRDLVLYADRLDPAAEVSDSLLTLLPGESATLQVRCHVLPDPWALTEPPVLRCAGQLRGRSAPTADR